MSKFQNLKCNLKNVTVGIAFMSLIATQATAQESDDTLRIAIPQPFTTLDIYNFPQTQVGIATRNIYDFLIHANHYTGEFEPGLATAWRQIDPETIELDLRKGVKFHSGNDFTAYDVKATIDYLIDPDVKLRFKNWYSWAKEVQIIDSHTVRIISHKPNAVILSQLAARIRIYDGKLLNSLETPEDKATYGKVFASGTGPYKMVSLDPAKGYRFERFNDYWNKDAERNPSPIANIEGIFMPDRQTQLASLLAGEVDVLQEVSLDVANQFSDRDGFNVFVAPSKYIAFMTLDAAGRSGVEAIKDVRVRQALAMAINREELKTNIIAGGDKAELPKSFCFEANLACRPTNQPFGYDPEGAKALLAEAGFADGLSFQLDVHAPAKRIAEAIQGYWAKIGVNVNLNSMPLPIMAQTRAQGKSTALVNMYPTAQGINDVHGLLPYFFAGNRDYAGDPIFMERYAAGELEFDLDKRAALYQDALAKSNEQVYLYPISEMPWVFVTVDNVVLDKNPLNAGTRFPSDFSWK